MASMASQLIDEITAHAQSDSLKDAQGICADGTYFLNNLRIMFSDVREDVEVGTSVSTDTGRSPRAVPA